MPYSLRVVVIQADDLKNVENGLFNKDKKSDPYVSITLKDKKFKTDVIENNLNPVWNKEFIYPLNGPLEDSANLQVRISDYEKIGQNRPLGEVNIPIGFLKTKYEHEGYYPLKEKDGSPTQGKIKLSFKYDDGSGGKKNLANTASSSGSSAAIGGGANSSSSASAGADTGADTDGGDATADELDEPEPEPGASPEAVAAFNTRRANRSKARKKRSDRKLSNKPADYQIRVNIIEARSLPGIGSLDPVIKVTVNKSRKQTTVKKSTNKPFYNELFFFNFFDSPAKLFDETIELSVFNARRLRKDAFLGSFKFDIGMVYDEPGHILQRKWVMLTDPNDRGKGAQGYVKLTVMVIGPGDEVPVLDTVVFDAEEDIEDNLLRPAGVELEPVDLSVRVYAAEDLPQMDPSFKLGIAKLDKLTGQSGKENCDPYAIVSFAGKKVQTQVIENSYYPEFNEELHLPMQIPSMCDKIKLQFLDSDLGMLLNQDDIIGTHYISLSQISSTDPEKGFLPSFGPAWINIYGAPREFETFEAEYADVMNKGMEEGCAYRGRVLLEINGTPASSDLPDPKTPLTDSDKLRVQPYLSRADYQLRVAFLEGTLISQSACKDQIEFEVSIGTVGNKFEVENDGLVQFSTTQPEFAVFDGVYYHYMPWHNKKPCIELSSEWEDVVFRFQSLNRVRSIIRALNTGIEYAVNLLDELVRESDVAIALGESVISVSSAGASTRALGGAASPIPRTSRITANGISLDGIADPDLVTILVAVCNALINAARSPLPDLPEGRYTKLDNYLREWREDEKVLAADLAQENRDQLVQGKKSPLEVIEALRDISARLNDTAVESQECIPDIIIWMISAGKRIAYARFPVSDFIYSDRPDERGQYFGVAHSVTMKDPAGDPKKKTTSVIPAHLQVKIWFGPAKSEFKWRNHNTGSGQLVVLAETYQNERYYPVKGWSDVLLPTDPSKWSDRAGKESRQPDQILLPEGWMWLGDWAIDPETADVDPDAGQDLVYDETFENERYYPLKGWGSVLKTDRPTWSDITGTEELPRDKFQLKQGWIWTSDWKVDQNRAVDSSGWEYAVTFSDNWHPSKKTMHFVRRRRWIRARERDPNFDFKSVDQTITRSKSLAEAGEGWQYAIDFKTKFFSTNRTLYTARRRRWRRERVLIDSNSTVQPGSTFGKGTFSVGTCLSYKESEVFQLRAHLYQARDLIGEDASGLSDPYVRVCFANRSAKSTLIEQNISPTWDQTLSLDDVVLYGNAQDIANSIPEVVIEVFDFDVVGSDEFLGRACVKPILRSSRTSPESAKLQWIKLTRTKEDAGELLAAFELIPLRDTVYKSSPLPAKTQIMEPLTKKICHIRRIPQDVRPVMERCRIEIFTWGLRHMKKYKFLSVDSPNVEFECGGVSKATERLRQLSKFPNFTNSFLSFDVDLPVEELYAPPLNIRVYDNRKFGRKPLVGVHSIPSLRKYRRKDNAPQKMHKFQEEEVGTASIANLNEDDDEDHGDGTHLLRSASAGGPSSTVVDVDANASDPEADTAAAEKKALEDEEPEDPSIDWWTKFFASAASGNQPLPIDFEDSSSSSSSSSASSSSAAAKNKKKKAAEATKIQALKKYNGNLLEVFREELELRFNFNDTLESFSLTRGKADAGDNMECGRLKSNFRIYPIAPETPPADPSELGRWLPCTPPSNAPTEVLVRVYIVRGIDLQALDDNGKSDPYVIVSLGGKKIIKDRDNYIPATLNPTFGRMYELNATLPVDNQLTITVMDWDAISADDLIGETKIDLEARLMSTHRGTVGLPESYKASGVNKWRDSQKPTEILKDWCLKMGLRAPVYKNEEPYNTVTIPGLRNARFEVFGDLAKNKFLAHQNAALKALRAFELVPEHVETRKLINPMQPDIEQGKLQMWVDIIPRELGEIMPPVDISPRKAAGYELRIIVWNTKDVIFADVSIMGEKMSDIYCKTFLRGLEKDRQKTDIHYRSLNGEGMFNWRCCLPFKYLATEDVLVIEEKAHFYSLDKSITKVPPLLAMQVWDNDFFKADDYLGNIDLNLSKMIPFEKSADKCKLGKEYKESDFISIFEKKRVKGWIPVTRGTKEDLELTGKVELEIELLTEEEAAERPAGQGQSEPNQYPHLDKPNRPATSFLWFLNPWKSFKYIIWKKFKWWIILFILLAIIIIGVAVFMYNFPNYSVRKILDV